MSDRNTSQKIIINEHIVLKCCVCLDEIANDYLAQWDNVTITLKGGLCHKEGLNVVKIKIAVLSNLYRQYY